MQVTEQTYKDVIKGLTEHYGLNALKEHKFIYEFFEAEEVPLFKLIYGFKESEQKNILIATFHIDLNPADAIQWFLRIEHLHPKIRLQECYIKDDRGETFLGTQAEALRQYKLEQEALYNWTSDKEEAEKYVKARVLGRNRIKNQSFIEDTDAMIEFNRMVKPEDDECH